MARLYTRSGDSGTTSLGDGTRSRKDAVSIEAFGTVDELTCHIGLVRASCEDRDVSDTLRRIQELLLECGAELATGPAGARRVLPEDITWVEHQIDRFVEQAPPLKTFVLPGGTPLAASLHVARAVCRRAERRVVAFYGESTPGNHIPPLLNRLSDLLFALARASTHRGGAAEEAWSPRPI